MSADTAMQIEELATPYQVRAEAAAGIDLAGGAPWWGRRHRGEAGMSRTSTVYLLHFEPAYVAPIGDTGRLKLAGHYLGSCAGDPADRLADHLAGRGSPLVRAAVAAGCAVTVVRTWRGGRLEERRLKRRHRHADYCPLCSPAAREPNELDRNPLLVGWEAADQLARQLVRVA